MLSAARDANIDDDRVAQSPGRRCETFLISWSTSVKNDFKTQDNHRLVTHNGKLSTALEGQSNRLDLVEKRCEKMEGL